MIGTYCTIIKKLERGQMFRQYCVGCVHNTAHLGDEELHCRYLECQLIYPPDRKGEIIPDLQPPICIPADLRGIRSMAEEQKILICMRVTYPGYRVPGSLQVQCADCGELVSVSPSVWLLLHDSPGADILCVECGLKRMLAEPGKISPPSPVQLDEIDEYLQQRGSAM